MTLTAPSGTKQGLHSGKTIDGNFHIGALLCQDPFGGLYQCTDNDDEELVIKLFSGGISIAVSTVPAPLHPNILVPQTVSAPKKLPRYAVFESNVKSTLRDWMKAHLQPTAESLLSVMLQLTSAVNTMHVVSKPMGILCPETIFIGEDFMGKMEVYILDLDISFSQRTVGHKWYQAPELLTDNQLTPQSDIWAVGAMMYEALFKKKPFPGKTHDEIVQKIKEGELKYSTYAKVPPNFIAVVQKCLQFHSADRYDNMVTLGGDLLLIQEKLGKSAMSDAAAKAIRDSIPPAKRISVVPPPRKTAKRISAIPPVKKKKPVQKRTSIIPQTTVAARNGAPQRKPSPDIAPTHTPNKTVLGMPAMSKPSTAHPDKPKSTTAPKERSTNATDTSLKSVENTLDTLFEMENPFVPDASQSITMNTGGETTTDSFMLDLSTSEIDLIEHTDSDNSLQSGTQPLSPPGTDNQPPAKSIAERLVVPVGRRIRTAASIAKQKVAVAAAVSIAWIQTRRHRKWILVVAAALFAITTTTVIFALTEKENDTGKENDTEVKTVRKVADRKTEPREPTAATPSKNASSSTQTHSHRTIPSPENTSRQGGAPDEAAIPNSSTGNQPRPTDTRTARRPPVDRAIKNKSTSTTKPVSAKRKKTKTTDTKNSGWASNPFGG
ncbi:MAG: protein kinase [Deltaproteobacteria bacterium]|nr:protein kinase [Deltaproteobacteria bacterium]MBN2670568.1 protein kinase [Deltaproteobacteria bacterium]